MPLGTFNPRCKIFKMFLTGFPKDLTLTLPPAPQRPFHKPPAGPVPPTHPPRSAASSLAFPALRTLP